MKYQILRYGCIPSTQELARDLLAGGAGDGTVVLADEQEGGRGRYGRQWVSPRGGVYASLITEWDPLLPFRAGVAVADVLRAVGIEARLKWPNDVLVGEKKIGGILIDATGEWAIVGVGVNHETAPVAGATCVAGETRSRLSRDRLLNMILEQFARLRRDEVLDRYRGLCDTIGRIVLVCTPRGVMRGKAVAVDAQGRLLIEGGRTRQAIDFGECVHVSNEATA